MIPEFDKLSDKEIELMFKAPVLACILIAGADGDIDKKEIRSAIEFATRKQKKEHSTLEEFYSYVAEDFEDKFKIVFQSYPHNANERNPLITTELAELNKILPRLEKTFATAFYRSIKEVSVRIAGSSGGLLGMRKIGDAEAQFVGLPMVKDPSR
jgi:hypothetical protein